MKQYQRPVAEIVKISIEEDLMDLLNPSGNVGSEDGIENWQ